MYLKSIAIKGSESLLSSYHLYSEGVILSDLAKCGWPLICEYANARKNKGNLSSMFKIHYSLISENGQCY